MPVDVNAQTIQFFACALSGGAIGVLYNLFAAIRRGFSFGRIATFFVDFTFWIAGTVVFFCILHISCSGEITWYGLMGVVLGLVLYLASASRFVYPLLLSLVKLIKKVMTLCLRVVIMPFYKIIKWVCRLFKPVKKLAQNTRKKTFNFVKNNVAKIKRLSILLKKI
ncbi:MAG: spore cortex biosynthesis protein YabQ [Clostridia bacterium]|nr:spore cortex biosynthesis protein YabQ [Clostridia bacterium]